MLSRVFLEIAAVFAALWGCYRVFTCRYPAKERYTVSLSRPENAEYEIRRAMRQAAFVRAPVYVQIYDCYEEIGAVAARLMREYPRIITEQRHSDDFSDTERR